VYAALAILGFGVAAFAAVGWWNARDSERRGYAAQVGGDAWAVLALCVVLAGAVWLTSSESSPSSAGETPADYVDAGDPMIGP
jgi:hypothetical protein